jgi:hypothetical protein
MMARVTKTALLLGFLALGISHGAEADVNLLPNASFRDGLAHWTIQNPSGDGIALVEKDGDKTALKIDARAVEWGETSVISAPIPVQPGESYVLKSQVKRLSGQGYRCTVGLVWQNKNGQIVAINGIWEHVLWGNDWEPCETKGITPANATTVSVKLGLEMGQGSKNSALFRGVSLESAGTAPPALAGDLFAARLPDSENQVRLDVQLTNSGGEELRDLKIKLNPPAEANVKLKELSVDRLLVGDRATVRFDLDAPSQDLSGEIAVQVEGKDSEGKILSSELATKWPIMKPQEVVTGTSHLPEPEIPAMKLRLGTYYFPVMIDWGDDGTRQPGVRGLDRSYHPLLGFYDESLPEIADWQIQWALSHGISWLAVDWYWNQGEEFIDEALHEGLMKSRFFDKIDICLLWANQEPTATNFRPYDYSPETMRELAATLCQRYFRLKNYLKVEGKPVFMMFLPAALVNDNGSKAQARMALDAFREVVAKNGFPGAFLVGLQNSPVVADLRSVGFDAVSSYSFMFAGVMPDRKDDRAGYDYDKVVRNYKDGLTEAKRAANAQGLPYIPTAWAGWDDLPRYTRKNFKDSSFTRETTPERLRSLVEFLPEVTDPSLQLALVEAWNEWGEGTAIEPSYKHRFGFLTSILDVLGVNPPRQRSVPVPDKETLARMAAKPESINHLPYSKRFHADGRYSRGFRSSLGEGRSLGLIGRDGVAFTERQADGLKVVARSAAAPVVLSGPRALDLDASAVKTVSLQFRGGAPEKAKLIWSGQKSSEGEILRKGDRTEAIFHLENNPAWKGRIDQLQFELHGQKEYLIPELSVGEAVLEGGQP